MTGRFLLGGRMPAAAVLAAALLLASAGCQLRRTAEAQPTPTARSSPTPAPTITRVKSQQVVDAGAAVDLHAQAGVSLRLRASAPSVSRSRLSRSYGYAPARGYYVTFSLTVTNTGSKPVDLGPANFRLRVPGEGTVTSYDGNAPYSGAARQLDTTELAPGESVRAPLTFDVARPHGLLLYLPDATPAITWRF